MTTVRAMLRRTILSIAAACRYGRWHDRHASRLFAACARANVQGLAVRGGAQARQTLSGWKARRRTDAVRNRLPLVFQTRPANRQAH
ncbi:MAG: hypothetical protein CVT74_06250, partial [Alphaproteobacteria bacterium HGW-Alphaproteobacteria-13]